MGLVTTQNVLSLICFVTTVTVTTAFECGWTTRLAKSNSSQFDDFDENMDEELVPEKKINHGRPVIRIESYPFVVKVGWNIEGKTGSCSGSIYDRKTVLTAGHCTDRIFSYLRNTRKIERNYTMYVKVGSSNYSWEEGITMNVKKVFKHPDFARSAGNGNDIGLVRLEKKLKWTEKVQPICLPLPGNNTETLDWDSEVKILGFGRLTDETSADTVHIGTMYPTKDLGNDYANQFLPEGTIGLERKTKSVACAGDSGGPSVQLRKGRYYQFGVTSGSDACSLGHFSVVTSVEYFNQWIIDTVGEPRY